MGVNENMMEQNRVDFFTSSTGATITFLVLFSLACFSTILMLAINIYKSFIITQEQKSIFHEVAITKKCDKSFKPDILIEVGDPVGENINNNNNNNNTKNQAKNVQSNQTKECIVETTNEVKKNK